MRTLLLLLPSIAALGFAPAPVFKDRPKDSEAVLRRLQGTWIVSRSEQGGRTMISMGQAHSIKIEKERWTYFYSQHVTPDTVRVGYTLKIDPTAIPAEIDCVQSKTYMLNGVYELKGDTLKVVFRANRDGKKLRATNLINPDPNDYFMQLERQR